jgi:hypothetical protein
VASFQEIEEYDDGLDRGNGPFIRLRHLELNLPGKRLVSEGAGRITKICLEWLTLGRSAQKGRRRWGSVCGWEPYGGRYFSRWTVF